MAQSQVPQISVQDLLAAQPQGFGQALGQVVPSLEKGMELADVLKRRKLEQQKLTLEMQEQVRKAKQEQKQQELLGILAKTSKPITSTTPVSTQVPATVGTVATTAPEVAVTPSTAPISPSAQIGVPTPGLQPSLEAERKAIQQSTFTQLFPKEAFTQEGKVQLGLNKNAPASEEQYQVYNTQWHDLPQNKEKEAKGQIVPDLPKGSTHKDLNDLVNQGRGVSYAGSIYTRSEAMKGMLELRKNQTQLTAADKLADAFNYGKWASGSDKMAAQTYQYANRGITAINQGLSETDLNTKRTLYEVAMETARTLIGNGQLAEKEVNNLMPTTAKQKYADWKEFLINEPVSIDADDFLKAFQKVLQRQSDFNKSIVKQSIIKRASIGTAAKELVDPEILDFVTQRGLEQSGFDEGDIHDILNNIQTSKKSSNKPSGTKPPLDSFFKGGK
jgi:hypothetical protein